jgi:4-amino-4-deoxy-L-arabinose transferase-like glycosyltransferase
MNILRRTSINEIIIVIAGAVLFIPFLGGVHLFDWDEINFAESAREMIVTGDYLTVQINFQPFWEKPPLFIWLQVLSMHIFGINEFAARFPNAVCGIFTLLLLYKAGKKVYDDSFGALWVLVYTCSILPFFYLKSGIIDPWFNFFIFAGLLQFIFFLDEQKRRKRWSHLLLSSVAFGLAALTKGPVAILLFGLTVGIYWILNKFRMKISFTQIFVYLVVLITVGGLWFIIQMMVGHFDVLKDFFIYQMRLFKSPDAGHGGFFLYHVVVLFFGVFPASVFALKGFRRSYYDDPFQKRIKYWMIILFFVVLIVFSIVRTKIVHYSSLCYFPLTFMGAYVISKILRERIHDYKWLNWIYAIIGILYGMFSVSLPFLMINKEWIIRKNWIQDEFAIANLRAPVHWSGYESVIGIIFIAGIIMIMFFFKKKRKLAYISVFINMLIFILLNILIITPKVEQYSQNALIEFCKERESEDCYVETLGMKSYAHLFYTKKQVPQNKNSYDIDWLLTGQIDKPVYFILRNRSEERFREIYPHLEFYREKNGYVFLKREPE